MKKKKEYEELREEDKLDSEGALERISPDLRVGRELTPSEASSLIDQTSNDPMKEFAKLKLPAIHCIATALADDDKKFRTDTAKWVLTCFADTAPKKTAEGSSAVNNLNFVNFDISKLRHMAEGALKLGNVDFKVAPTDSKREGTGER